MNDMTNSGENRRIHPGSGRRKAPVFPKGRLLAREDCDVIARLLGDRPRQRDMLIEYLHLIQDAEGCLPAGHMQALGEELKIPMAEVYEVASFYAHFDIVRDGEERPAPVTVRVCESLSCMMAGAEQVIAELEKNAPGAVRVLRAPCMGRCDTAPVAEVGHRHVDHASVGSLAAAARNGEIHAEIPAYTTYENYVADGGYGLLRDCLAGNRDRDEIVATMENSGLRGLGGAGFPAGMKWKLVRQQPGPRICAINGDEGEPGTFKDR